jgi:FSR family fosmidomycin resistance protein-like MFS transporter
LTIEAKVNTEKRSFKELWVITIGHGMTHWYPASFYLLLPLIGKELGLSYSQIGFILAFKSVSSTIAGVPGGMLVDAVGKKGLLMAIALFWIGFPYLIMGFTNSYWLILFCMTLVGIGNTLWHPTAIPIISQRYSDRKGFALSIHGMGANMGDALAPLAVGALLTIFNWHTVVIGNVIPGIVIGIILLLLLRNIQGQTKTKAEEDYAEKAGLKIGEYLKGLVGLFKNRSLILISISSGFRAMTQSSLYVFLPLYLSYEMGFSPFLVGLGMFLLQAAGFIAAPISGHVSDKVGRKKIVMGSMMMTAVVLVFMALAGKSYIFIFFIALLGFFLYALRSVMQAWLMETTPKKMAGTSISLLFSVQSLFSSVSPLLGGIIADKFGLFSAFYYIAATIIIANFLVFFIPKEQKQIKEIDKTTSF